MVLAFKRWAMSKLLKLIAELRKARLRKDATKPSAPPLPQQVVVYLYDVPCVARSYDDAKALATQANRTLLVRAICAANGRRYEMRGEA